MENKTLCIGWEGVKCSALKICSNISDINLKETNTYKVSYMNSMVTANKKPKIHKKSKGIQT